MSQEKLFNAVDLFEIKGAHLPILSLFIKTSDIKALEQGFAEKFIGKENFFEGDAIVINLLSLNHLKEPNSAEINFPELVDLLKQYGLSPIAIKGGNVKQIAAALKQGLINVPDLLTSYSTNKESVAKKISATATLDLPPELKSDRSPDAASAASAVNPHPSNLVVPKESLVITHPLRSGQQVYAQGGDVIVLAIVNVGAEVIADGNIHVYAPLRGRAIAGAKGNTRARIFTSALNAEILSIAGIYITADGGYSKNVDGKPAQVHLQTFDGVDKLIVTPLTN